jgi:ABC-type lipoprotein export system ATPase subunit
MNNILTLTNITKSYDLGSRSLEVLRGIDLSVSRGDFLVLQGASGSGKSTLLQLMGGLDKPTAGQVIFNGKDLATLSDSQLSRSRNLRIGFVFQSYNLLPELTALENVCLPSDMARLPSKPTRALATELLTQVGLKDRINHRPTELSGGEQQRVAIARALINQPELLLADEPTGNLDSKTGNEIIEILKGLHQTKQMTLIIATHDQRVALAAPSKIELIDGKINGLRV